MKPIKNMSLAVINDELTIDEMEEIQAGAPSGFCQGFAAAGAVYTLGCVANLWNPLGDAGLVAVACVGLYCALS